MPEPLSLLFLAVLIGTLAFHFWFALVPSLRYFVARPSAYVLGAAAYLGIVIPPFVDAFVFPLPVVVFRIYAVTAFALLTIIVWRPFAFVRASGGPRRAPVADEQARRSD